MQIKLISKNLNDTNLIGEIISKYLYQGSVILLNGDLGAGKTTLTKAIGKGLKINDDINSPTFNILKCYFNNNGLNLYHIDSYRLKDVNEDNKNIGLEEVIEGDGVAVIEWSEYIDEILDHDTTLEIDIVINKDDNSREFTFNTNNKNYRTLFNELELIHG